MHLLALYVEKILIYLEITFLYLCSVNKVNVQTHFTDDFFFKKKHKMPLKEQNPINVSVLIVCLKINCFV